MNDLLLLFLEFFKIGLFTIGGGYAMIPLVKDVVISHEWMSEEFFYNFIGVADSTPGPISINMATYIGSSVAGLPGSIVATLALILPSIIIITLIAAFLNKLTKSKWFKNMIEGIKPVVIGLILSTGIILVFKNIGYVSLSEFNIDIKSVILTSILILLELIITKIFKKKIPTILFIVIAAVCGILVNLF